jgi:uncharacterized protein (DUF488 family)
MDAFVAVLKQHRVQGIIDVRSSPYSKFRPEFSQAPLQMALQTRGMEYLFLGDLLGGQPKDLNCYVEGKVDYQRVREQGFFRAGLQRLKELPPGRFALMCSEGRPEDCHRSKLIGEALAAEGIPVTHIDEKGELVVHNEVIRRLTGGQLDLFGQPAFTSRKRYPEEDR